MSDTKWTPGEWFVHDFRDRKVGGHPMDLSGITVSCDHPATITVCSMGRALLGSPTEALGNAHLIAAAPELYEALENALYVMEDGHQSNAKEMARKALAKARGENHD